ncbi:hypothetical protein ACTT7V_003252 [Escherichia coli]
MEEHDLHASGFTKMEIMRIKRYLETGDSLDRVLLDLSRYFKMFVSVTTVMAVITILSLILGSTTQAISSAIAAVFLVIVFLLVMPIKVGYKSWKLLKMNVSDFDRRG